MKKWIYIVIFVVLNFNNLYSVTRYVDTDVSSSGNGLSWATAYKTLQEALDVAISGDEIWVAEGTYLPTYDYGLGGGTRYNHFRMIDGVAIYGGFAGTETSTSQRTNYGEGEANETILSGDLNSNGVDNNDAYHIFYIPAGINLTSSSILNGFTITLARANGAFPHERGGAIYIYDDNKSPHFENITFKNNYAQSQGSVMFAYNTSITINNCNFKNNNTVNSGGAIYSEWSTYNIITNSQFYNNQTTGGGGAIHYYQCLNSNLINVLIYDNIADEGGAIYLRNVNANLINVTITKNRSNFGGAIKSHCDSYTVINNSVIYGNDAIHNADEFYIDCTSDIILNYCSYTSNATSLYLEAGSTFTATNNNISSDPLFIDEVNDDYRLSKTSPCLDAGNNSYNSETYDIRSDYPRKLNKNSQSSGIIDIGAYEFRAGYDAIVITTNNATNIETDAAISGATLFADLFTPITAKGIVWDTLSTPTISLSTKTNEGTTNGLFTSNISGLKSNTTYYVRAYVANGSGTTYGNEISFTTLPYGIDEDGNQDGIIDTVQAHVYNYYDENSGNYITIESLEEDTIYDVSQLTAYEDKYHYPLGLMSFKVKASFSTIKIYYHGISSLANYTYRKQKLDGTYYDYTRATFAIQTINGNPTAVVTLRLQDGKTGDLDGTVNGIIYDPGGPAISIVAVPTLSEWAKYSLMIFMILFSVYFIKRKI